MKKIRNSLALMLILSISFMACNSDSKTKSGKKPQAGIQQKVSPEDKTVIIDHTEQERVILTRPPDNPVPNPPQPQHKALESIQEDYHNHNAIQEYAHPAEMGKRFDHNHDTRATDAAHSAYHPHHYPHPVEPVYPEPYSTNQETYAENSEQKFQRVHEQPLSTFSIDVDNASYTNTRRILQSGNLPPKEAVRIEEFINYFDYAYAQPNNGNPFQFSTEMSPCPWNKERYLLKIGMKGKEIPFQSLPPMNLVFLVDVSGSMNPENRLPLLKRALHSLTAKLRPQDQVSIVVYAGAAGLVLPCTPGNDKTKIYEALEKLKAGGSTAGGQGIELAYKTALEHFKNGGINRVILATDGDFNVGVSSDEAMKKLIEEKRKTGVYLTVLGFGMGNLKDSKMETLADHGNGNYFYIDTYEEAMRVLVDKIDGTLYSLAGDVKLQLEFNPAKVKHYRLIGYDNRRLNKEDFNNDKKDAGELGAGHTVTALYEIIPADSPEEPEGSVDPLKYGIELPKTSPAAQNNPEWLTLKFRYKLPDESKSRLITQGIIPNNKNGKMSEDFQFCSAVAAFGMILKDSEYKGNANYAMVQKLAEGAISRDPGGYRAEFIRLVRMAESMQVQAQK